VVASKTAVGANKSITRCSIVLADCEKGSILLEYELPSHLRNEATFDAIDTRECLVYVIGASADWMAMFDIKPYIEKVHPELLKKTADEKGGKK
jgi:hypothetical protein